MFSSPSIQIGRIFGIPLEVNVSWLLIFALVASSLAFSYFPSEFGGWSSAEYLVAGVLTAILFFASVVLHELSHSLVARAGGLRISRVTLFLFGGVAQMEGEPGSPGREFVMAAAGPAASVLLSVLFAFGYVVAQMVGAPSTVWGPMMYLAAINLSVAIFNLLPGFPLDGGRVLRSFLWWSSGDILKATRWASRVGQFIGWGLVAIAVLGVVNGQLGLIWLGLIGWFLSGLAESAYRQQVARTVLASVPVRSIMSTSPVVVPGEMSLEELAHSYFLGQRHSRYPVAVGGEVVGLVTLAAAKQVPRDRWPDTPVSDVTERDLGRLIVSADATVDSIVARLGPDDSGAVLVVDEGRLVGVLTRSDVMHALEVAGP